MTGGNMLLLMTALLVAQTVPVEPEQAEIVVIGQRLSHWTGKYAIRGTKLRCATKTSSGDREIDALGCKAFDACADQLSSRIAASDDKSLPKESRVSMKDGIKHDLSICVADQRVNLIAQLADHRRAVQNN